MNSDQSRYEILLLDTYLSLTRPRNLDSIGKKSLFQTLGDQHKIDEISAEQALSNLVGSGIVSITKGRGGSIELASTYLQLKSGIDILVELNRGKYSSEDHLYDPFTEVIKTHWTAEHQYAEAVCQKIARQGRRKTGGQWTRPDIVTIGLIYSKFLRPRYRHEVTTFEVKHEENLNLQAVAEANEQKKHTGANRAYLLAYIPYPNSEELTNIIRRVTDSAKDAGVGLIIARDPQSRSTWTTIHEAEYHEGDYLRLHDFIDKQLAEQDKAKLERWPI